MEQRLGQLRLHAEHVDEKAQSAQVVGQAIESAGAHCALRVDFGLCQRFDLVAHVQRGLRGLLHAQHRQHAAHRRQLVGHRDQQIAARRLAEILVNLLFDFRQRSAQFLHHAAHGLAVRHAAVQLFHPAVEHLGVGTDAHVVNAAGQAPHAAGQLGVVELRIFQRSIDIQDGRGHLHRQTGRRFCATRHGLRRGRRKRVSQRLAFGEQALQRFTHQRELFGQAGHAVQLAARHCRPGVAGDGHALAGQRQHGRVEAAQAGGLVVGRGVLVQLPGLAHGHQARCAGRIGGGLRMAAEKQQVMDLALRQLARTLHPLTQLRQHARGDALRVDVHLQQAQRLRFENSRRQLPEIRQLARAVRGAEGIGRCARAHPEAGAQVAHLHQRILASVGTNAGTDVATTGAHQRQNQRFHHAARSVVGVQRLGARVGGQGLPMPVELPQIGRVDAVGRRQLQGGAVLREQHDRRHGLARQLAGDEVQQRERRFLDRLDGRQVDHGRLAGHARHRRFAGAQHLGRRRQPDEFQCTHTLVQLVARGAQHGRVDAAHIRAAHRVGFLQVAAQGLVGGFQRTAQFGLHPGQGAQVIARRGAGRVVSRVAEWKAAGAWGRRGLGHACARCLQDSLSINRS